MSCLRSRFRGVLLVLGLVAWVAGGLASQVHELLVQHARCAEHGEIVELGTDTPANDVAASDAGADDHDHGCSLPPASLLGVATVAQVLLPTPPDVRPDEPVHAHPGAPRGPPLTYAPKTSPPALLA